MKFLIYKGSCKNSSPYNFRYTFCGYTKHSQLCSLSLCILGAKTYNNVSNGGRNNRENTARDDIAKWEDDTRPAYKYSGNAHDGGSHGAHSRAAFPGHTADERNKAGGCQEGIYGVKQAQNAAGGQSQGS